MESSQRYLDNTFQDFQEEKGLEKIQALQLSLKTDFDYKFKSYCELRPENLTHSKDSEGNQQPHQFMYIGSGGHAVALWKLGLCFKSIGMEEEAEENFKKAVVNLEKNAQLLSKQPNPYPSFLLSMSGFYTIQFLTLKQLQKEDEADTALKNLLNNVKLSSKLTSQNEILFGRAGYLYCLLLVKKYYPEVRVEKEVSLTLHELYEMGTDKGKSEEFRFTFHDQVFLGAAHGLAGIFYLMLEALKLESDEMPVDNKIKETLKHSCQKILALQEEDGNLKYTLDSNQVFRVFWCHGAPGFIAMLCAAYETYKEDKYLAAAELAGECTWKKGILKKGNCLCHGISGNAYCLMTLYRKTKNIKWKYRALKFASILANPEFQSIFAQVEDPLRKVKGIADFPESLLEGFAGELCMYADFMNKDENNILFPGYEIN